MVFNGQYKEIIMAVQNTLIHVDPAQREALMQKARQHGHSIETEVKEAIDWYLVNVSEEELKELDQVTLEVQQTIQNMNKRLDGLIERFDIFFKEIEKIRTKGKAL